MKYRSIAQRFGVVVATATPAAFAQTDYSAITGAADWGAVALGVVGIAAAFALVLAAMKGSRKLLSMIGR